MKKKSCGCFWLRHCLCSEAFQMQQSRRCGCGRARCHQPTPDVAGQTLEKTPGPGVTTGGATGAGRLGRPMGASPTGAPARHHHWSGNNRLRLIRVGFHLGDVEGAEQPVSLILRGANWTCLTIGVSRTVDKSSPSGVGAAPWRRNRWYARLHLPQGRGQAGPDLVDGVYMNSTVWG